eukprot:Gb_26720 [translate_table: standard]
MMKCFYFANSVRKEESRNRKPSCARSLSREGKRSNCDKVSDDAGVDPAGPNIVKISSQKPINLREFTFAELKTATRNFSRGLMVGEGGFGCVYKGVIKNLDDPQTKTEVAVKRLNKKGLQGHKEWVTEVHFLGLVEHPNLVKLVGYCAEDDERGIQRLLVYEFMPNKSLEDHLFSRALPVLPWSVRLQIALGAAHGLTNLHEEMDVQIIFRDFKSSNILLDEDFNPKLSDFGMARQGPTGGISHVSTAIEKKKDDHKTYVLIALKKKIKLQHYRDWPHIKINIRDTMYAKKRKKSGNLLFQILERKTRSTISLEQLIRWFRVAIEEAKQGAQIMGLSSKHDSKELGGRHKQVTNQIQVKTGVGDYHLEGGEVCFGADLSKSPASASIWAIQHWKSRQKVVSKKLQWTGETVHRCESIGTAGYAAPEYIQTGHLTSKSDVWSFGVVLYELLTGRRSMDKSRPKNEQKLLEWVKPYLSESKKFRSILDPRLEGQYSLKEAQKVASLAHRCLVKQPRARPKMSEVVDILKQIIHNSEIGSPQSRIVSPSVENSIENLNTEPLKESIHSKRRILLLKDMINLRTRENGRPVRWPWNPKP